jgi:hypothetical protein
MNRASEKEYTHQTHPQGGLSPHEKKQVNMYDRPCRYTDGELPADQTGEVVMLDHVGDPTSEEAAASCKVVVNPGEDARFFIKKAMEGPDSGHFLNPHSIYYSPSDATRLDNRRGQKRFEYYAVSKICFDTYVNFLQTRVPSYLRAAEREAFNA